MSADQRLRRKSEFDAVFRDGVGAASGALTLRARVRDADAASVESTQPCRFGFAVSRRLGGAVQRNRIRRRLRAAARQLNADGECAGLDVVVIARQGAAEAEFVELDATLRRLVRRALRRLDAEGGAS